MLRSVQPVAESVGIAWVVLCLGATAHGQTGVCERAAELFRERAWTEAATAFGDCEKSAPGRTDALLFRGKALVNSGEFTGAASSLESYCAQHPTSDDALYLLGYVRFRQDQPKESLVLFARAAKLKEPQAGDLKIAALDYVLLDDYASAARYLEQSLQMNPKDFEARYHLGRVRYQQNKFDEAIAAFEAVLQEDPRNEKAEDNLGLCLEAKNQNQAAIAAYRKAIELDSASALHSEQPYLNLGKLLTTLNQPSDAAPLLARAVEIQPTSSAAHYELGRAEFALEHFDDARGQLEDAVRIEPGNSSSHYLLGRTYARLGKSREAAEQFKLTESLIRKKNGRSGGMASSR